jgi:uncharacterized lipoprotein YajG
VNPALIAPGFYQSIAEVSVKKTATLSLLVMMVLALVAAGCRGRKSSSTSTAPTTQTIAPAAGQPATNGGDAVTQTVDIEDGRSEDDGGVLTNPQKAKTGAKAPAKPPVKKKK